MQEINRELGVLPNIQLQWETPQRAGIQETLPRNSQGILEFFLHQDEPVTDPRSCFWPDWDVRNPLLLPGFDGFLLWGSRFNIH